ncbi:MAG: threonine synthase [Coriobacteriia bacterium]|nr:threonine synthase [Coriobacteriia bacterium]
MPTNRYIDTRGRNGEPIEFTEAIVKGLADGGGLFVPERLPHFELEEILAFAGMPYYARAAAVYSAFEPDMSASQVEELMRKTYGDRFDTPEIAPITSLSNDMHVLELWHGPTSAFKDMALQCLPNFFSASAKKLKEEGKIDTDFLILVATSGDTGKGALEGFRDAEGIKIAVLYPEGGVSDIQYKQMATQRGENVMVWAVRGNFDDCQTGVKTVFSDGEFAKKLAVSEKVALSSANSINWGRLLPQVVYYVSSYASMVAAGKVAAGDPIDVCVPTGNFGNILAAWYARQIGTPIERFVCASNDNHVLTDFINTGEYDIRGREFILTASPSMDILVSSNVERQVFELSGRNTELVDEWMRSLKQEGHFELDASTKEKLQRDYAAGYVGNAEALATIKEVFESEGYLIDPHTAVAMKVAQNHKGSNPMLVASTAHWAKFGVNVYRALHGIAASDDLPDEVAKLTDCQLNELIADETGVHNIPAGLAELDGLPIRFTKVIDGDVAAIEGAVEEFLS